MITRITITDNGHVHIIRDGSEFVHTYYGVSDRRVHSLFKAMTTVGFTTFRYPGGVDCERLVTSNK